MDQILTTKIMETSTSLQEDHDQISFNKVMKKDLRITANWSTFISIFTLSLLSIAFFGFSYFLYKAFSLSGVPMSEILSETPWQGYVLVLFIPAILVVLILASLSLLLFSFEVKKAVDYENSDAMDLSIDLLLKFFRYNGIIVIGVFLLAFSTYLYFKSFTF